MDCEQEVLKSGMFQQPQFDSLILASSFFVIVTSNFELHFVKKQYNLNYFLRNLSFKAKTILVNYSKYRLQKLLSYNQD